MKPRIWVLCCALICILVTVNSSDIQDDKPKYGDFESSVSEWRHVLQNAVGNPDDKPALENSETPCTPNPCKNEGDCAVDGTVAKCTCKGGFTGPTCEIVKTPCTPNPCKNNGDCAVDGTEAKCTCKEGFTGPTCEIVKTPCTPNPCKNNGDCAVVGTEAKCTCKEGFTGPICEIVTCSIDTDCKNEAPCKGEEGKKTCACKPGTSGDKCETITACIKGGKYEECEGDKGECIFENGSAVCKCTGDGKKLDESRGQCRKPCNVNTDCLNEATCKEGVVKFCDCKNGTVGDTCEIVTACEKDGKYKTCTGDDGKCMFVKGEAICNCTEDKALDNSVGHCKFKFCVPNSCKDGSECIFDETKKVGVCKCTEENKYYDYFKNECTEPDKCILKKTICEENRECKKGKCECIKNYKDVNGTCKSDFCNSNPCFTGATCDDTDGKLKCSCKEGEYFDGAKKCADGICFLGSDFKKNCMKACPTNFKAKEKDKECEAKEGYIKCSTDCGYGYCIQKNGEETTTCSCISSIAEKDKDGKKCILKKDVCASKILTKDFTKCNCTGEEYKLKQASNGITCELMTCLDESARNDCKQKGAQCVTDGKKGYTCKCPIGYMMDNDKEMCTDPCSIARNIRNCHKFDQFCYNSVSELEGETGDCKCPPALKMGTKDGDTETKCINLAENVYVIHGIPVKKKRYEMQGKINKVLLNADLIQSMKSTFQYFDYGYLQDFTRLNDEVLNVSVWIQFNKPVSDSELKRISEQTRTFEDKDYKSESLWPPYVLLDEGHLDGVKPEALSFCSEESRNTLCGKDAICTDNKCSCARGFKTVEYSIRDMGKYRIERCEDIDECATETHTCGVNTTCINTPGDFYCQCNANFKKEKDPVHSRVIMDKSDCYDLCTPNPCNKGTCVLKEDKSFDCKCPDGSEGSFCDSTDVSLASAKKSTAIVGSILGVILGLALIALFLLYRRMKQNSYSEDFSPSSRQDPSEMF